MGVLLVTTTEMEYVLGICEKYTEVRSLNFAIKALVKYSMDLTVIKKAKWDSKGILKC